MSNKLPDTHTISSSLVITWLSRNAAESTIPLPRWNIQTWLWRFFSILPSTTDGATTTPGHNLSNPGYQTPKPYTHSLPTILQFPRTYSSYHSNKYIETIFNNTADSYTMHHPLTLTHCFLHCTYPRMILHIYPQSHTMTSYLHSSTY